MIIWNLTAIKVVQAKEKGFIYDLQTKPFSLFDKRDFFSALPNGGGDFFKHIVFFIYDLRMKNITQL